MSVKKPDHSPYFHFEFKHGGRKFRGSTGCTERRAAERVEREKRAAVKAEAAAQVASPSMTIDVAVGRYWQEVGQHAATPDLWGNLERISDWIGADTPISEIGNDLVTRLIARRRAEYRKGDPKLGLVSPSTVNRSFTMILRRVLTRARTEWDIEIKELRWRSLILKEPKERVRELSYDEEARLEAVERPEFTVLRRFAQITGLRRSDALITWPQVDWSSEVIRVVQKGDDPHVIPLTPEIHALLWPLWVARHHETAVFTYVAPKTTVENRTKRVIVAGSRYPITEAGWQSQHKRSCAKAKVVDFRIHDERHTSATRLLRGSGNLKVVQAVMGHKSIGTTLKYAHINDADIRAAMRAAAADGETRRAEHDRRAKALKRPSKTAAKSKT